MGIPFSLMETKWWTRMYIHEKSIFMKFIGLNFTQILNVISSNHHLSLALCKEDGPDLNAAIIAGEEYPTPTHIPFSILDH